MSDLTRGTKGPLHGVRIIEVATVLMAPYATQILGDMGAEVIKVESDVLDTGRMLGGGVHDEISGVALNLHRNKRSIRIDLRNERGLGLLEKLLGSATVFVTNLRPGALRRLGVDYDSVGVERPGLIYCEAHGFRSDSPDGERPAFDDVIQAETGLPRFADFLGHTPSFVPSVLADKLSGLYVAQSILGALVHHRATGEGQRVEVPMFDSVLSFNLAEHLAQAAVEGGAAGYCRILSVHRGPHKTADGYLAVIPYADKDWRAIFGEVGCEGELEQPPFSTSRDRHANPDVVYGRLAEILAQRTTEEWLKMCLREGVPYGVVPSVQEIIEDDCLHRGVLEWAEHPELGRYRQIKPPTVYSRTPMSVRRHAPFVGEHTVEVLREIGIADGEIDTLLDDRVVVPRGVPAAEAN